jgi:uncharacterized protein (DUF1697 family)
MALVVFMRGVNVGGHKAFRPAALARELAAFDVVNLGAAGTFVVRKPVAQAKLRAAIQKRLPFTAELMIVSGRDLLDLVDGAPFTGRSEDATRYVSVLAKPPRTPPRLPIHRPDGEDWQVQVFRLSGRFALSLHRRVGRNLLYPNEVVEKALAVPATTRNWTTIAAVADILEKEE